MEEFKKELEGKYGKETVKTVEELRLIDDALFRVVCARIEVCQEILRTLLRDKELEVIYCKPQETITSLHKEVKLDVLCRLGNGKYVNVEVQKSNGNDDIKRCRFHLATITANRTDKGTDFADIPDVTVVYITEYDLFKNGQSVTCAEMCYLSNGVYMPVNDGAKIYYANTVVDDDTEEAKLLSLFLRKDAFNDEKFPNISEAVNYFKNSEEGVSDMCDVVEKYAQKRVQEHEHDRLVEIAKKMLHNGMETHLVAEYMELSIEEVEEIAKELD